MDEKEAEKRRGSQIVWKKFIFILTIHIFAVCSLTTLHRLHSSTIMFGLLTYQLAGLGITAGAHRLWCHRSYKAKLPLRIFLALMSCVAWQVPILQWCRDHRTHHKFTDTDADPHNSTRGLFFSHFGNIICKKHPDVVRKGRTISVDDLLADPVVRLQKKFFLPAALFMCVILPTWIPYYFWSETIWHSFCTAMLRYCLNLNAAFSVNSFAHWIGSKPYDANISSADNEVVAMFTLGEGFHNYHHIFPQDYATSEFGLKLNPSKAFIDSMAFLGLAYDLKTASKSRIDARKKRSGKLLGSHDERSLYT